MSRSGRDFEFLAHRVDEQCFLDGLFRELRTATAALLDDPLDVVFRVDSIFGNEPLPDGLVSSIAPEGHQLAIESNRAPLNLLGNVGSLGPGTMDAMTDTHPR